MEAHRLRSNAFYHALTEPQRKLYKSGLPTKYIGTQLRDLKFVPYYKGFELNKSMTTATQQAATLINFANDITPAKVASGTWCFHSAPTDEAAFKAAAAVYEAMSGKGFACRCASTSAVLREGDKIANADVYLTHGVLDTGNAAALWALRDFIRDRDGSLHMVVMTSAKELSLDTLIHEQLRMRVDYLFCLEDDGYEIIADRKARVQHA